MSPPKNTIRPASDLVRQAVFNMLTFELPDRTFYDVFAGTGIVGIEALSRGAAKAIFVEKDGRMLGLIRQNLELSKLAKNASVRGSDAFVWGTHFVSGPDPEIVFLGPPYPLFEKGKEQMLELVSTVQQKLKDEDILVLQFPREQKVEELPDFENWYRLRQYGKTRVGIWQRNSSLRTDDGAEASSEVEEAEVESNEADDQNDDANE